MDLDHHPDDPDDPLERRLTALEIKATWAEDLLERLDALVASQQSQIELLARELLALRDRQTGDDAPPSRDPRDDRPPHY